MVELDKQKPVKIAGKWYHEGVNVSEKDANKMLGNKPKPLPKKPVGLAGSDKVIQGLKERRKFFKNIAGQ